MIFLWILLSIVLLITFILFLRIHLIIDYHDQTKIYIRVLFFKIDVFKLIKSFRSEKKQNTSEKKEKIAKNLEETKKKSSPKNILDFADFLLHLAGVIRDTLEDFFSKAKVNLNELMISVGSDDAADTAIRCAVVTQAANGFCAVLQHFSTFRCNSKKLNISPNFVSSETKFSLNVVISCTLVHILGVYLRANMRFFD